MRLIFLKSLAVDRREGKKGDVDVDEVLVPFLGSVVMGSVTIGLVLLGSPNAKPWSGLGVMTGIWVATWLGASHVLRHKLPGLSTALREARPLTSSERDLVMLGSRIYEIKPTHRKWNSFLLVDYWLRFLRRIEELLKSGEQSRIDEVVSEELEWAASHLLGEDIDLAAKLYLRFNLETTPALLNLTPSPVRSDAMAWLVDLYAEGTLTKERFGEWVDKLNSIEEDDRLAMVMDEVWQEVRSESDQGVPKGQGYAP